MASLLRPPSSRHPIFAQSQQSAMASSPSYNNCTFALEKYLLLQEQHQELSSHLEQIRPRQHSASSVSTRSSSSSSYHSSASSTSSSSSSSSSPTLPTRTGCGARQHGRTSARRNGRSGHHGDASSLDTIVDEETLYEISAEEQRLLGVNESIKRALTELLNTDTVRGDKSMRMWAQARLMETEKELRSGRRRRS
ncbi:hypothetical protein CDD83_6006 [Cordyceps sp. RAO-2017]|nr:hypothetical protein CDD83_6006 [Cordyceps sp. RAO-2017]